MAKLYFFQIIISHFIILLNCLTYSGVLAKVKRCYVCKMGCDDTSGFLQTCPGVNLTAWGAEVPIPQCYKYHLNPEELEKSNKPDDKTDITPEDKKHFQFPKEYRNCAYLGKGANGTGTKLYDRNHTMVCNSGRKFNCFPCEEKDGCNGHNSTASDMVEKVGGVKFVAILTMRFLQGWVEGILHE